MKTFKKFLEENKPVRNHKKLQKYLDTSTPENKSRAQKILSKYDTGTEKDVVREKLIRQCISLRHKSDLASSKKRFDLLVDVAVYKCALCMFDLKYGSIGSGDPESFSSMEFM